MSKPSSPEYTREEMREACEQNYRAGRGQAFEEAAQLCDAATNNTLGGALGAGWATAMNKAAAAIRALKGSAEIVRKSEERTTDE